MAVKFTMCYGEQCPNRPDVKISRTTCEQCGKFSGLYGNFCVCSFKPKVKEIYMPDEVRDNIMSRIDEICEFINNKKQEVRDTLMVDIKRFYKG